MTGSLSSLFAAEVIECMAEDREPTREELYAVAERIGRDGGIKPLVSWNPSAPVDAAERALLRAAHAALRGAEAA